MIIEIELFESTVQKYGKEKKRNYLMLILF
jgi:hypothetical protein